MSKTRNWVAVHAHFRSAGPMKHKNTPKGGSRNMLMDYLEQYEEEKLLTCYCEHCMSEVDAGDDGNTPRNWEF